MHYFDAFVATGVYTLFQQPFRKIRNINVQNEGGRGGPKAVWTMLKKKDEMVPRGVPKWNQSIKFYPQVINFQSLAHLSQPWRSRVSSWALLTVSVSTSEIIDITIMMSYRFAHYKIEFFQCRPSSTSLCPADNAQVSKMYYSFIVSEVVTNTSRTIFFRCGGQSRQGQEVDQQQDGSTPLEPLQSVLRTLFPKFQFEFLILFSNFNKSLVGAAYWCVCHTWNIDIAVSLHRSKFPLNFFSINPSRCQIRCLFVFGQCHIYVLGTCCFRQLVPVSLLCFSSWTKHFSFPTF